MQRNQARAAPGVIAGSNIPTQYRISSLYFVLVPRVYMLYEWVPLASTPAWPLHPSPESSLRRRARRGCQLHLHLGGGERLGRARASVLPSKALEIYNRRHSVLVHMQASKSRPLVAWLALGHGLDGVPALRGARDECLQGLRGAGARKRDKAGGPRNFEVPSAACAVHHQILITSFSGGVPKPQAAQEIPAPTRPTTERC